MPSNATHVCCRCRTHQRSLANYQRLGRVCSVCHRQMENIGQHRPIPKTRDNKGWAELEADLEYRNSLPDSDCSKFFAGGRF